MYNFYENKFSDIQYKIARILLLFQFSIIFFLENLTQNNFSLRKDRYCQSFRPEKDEDGKSLQDFNIRVAVLKTFKLKSRFSSL